MVSTPVYGTVHLSHRTPVGSIPPAVAHVVGGVVGSVENPTVIATPSVDPQFSAAAVSGTYVVPIGTASVIVKVNADADE